MWHTWEIYSKDYLLGLNSVINLKLSSGHQKVPESTLYREIFDLEAAQLQRASQEIENYPLVELEDAAKQCGVEWV